MLKAAIVLWLLASIYGFEIADATKTFDVIQAKKDVQKKIVYLLVMSVTDWRDTQIFLTILHNNASLVFQKKLTQELDDVRLGVQTARKKGTDASFCIEDTENQANRRKSSQGNPRYVLCVYNGSICQ
ncbi:hypothetical protein KM043_017522 [Ampulex compressa]|nr:hypothetical protein KM043_017522 [Ampulex compressa]